MAAARVITIDGPVGAGKGTIAGRVAARLGFHLLDSGAIYRVLAIVAADAGVGSEDIEGLIACSRRIALEFRPSGDDEEPLDVVLDGRTVTGRLRTNAVAEAASRLAGLQPVRQSLRALQRSFRREPGLVADGRDMGTVVFPDADLKIYLTASPEVRAERRYKQLKDKEIGVSLLGLLRSIRERDERDITRAVAPLRPADDAIVVDGSELTIEQVVEEVMARYVALKRD